VPLIAERLEHLVTEMDERGIRFEDAVREFEKRFIARVLQRSAGNLSRAAAALGVHRNTLTRKMLAYRLKRRA
jgi:transcriptional regulator with PAS, ATPase and Fis domain